MPEDSVPESDIPKQASRPSRSRSTTVKRILNRSFELPRIQREGFTPPSQGHWTKLPHEFIWVLAEEGKRVAIVILEVFRQTVGYVGDGPDGRREWAAVSSGHFARKGFMDQGDAARALTRAVKAGYLIRRRRGRTWEYQVRWRTPDTCS